MWTDVELLVRGVLFTVIVQVCQSQAHEPSGRTDTPTATGTRWYYYTTYETTHYSFNYVGWIGVPSLALFILAIIICNCHRYKVRRQQQREMQSRLSRPVVSSVLYNANSGQLAIPPSSGGSTSQLTAGAYPKQQYSYASPQQPGYGFGSSIPQPEYGFSTAPPPQYTPYSVSLNNDIPGGIPGGIPEGPPSYNDAIALSSEPTAASAPPLNTAPGIPEAPQGTAAAI